MLIGGHSLARMSFKLTFVFKIYMPDIFCSCFVDNTSVFCMFCVGILQFQPNYNLLISHIYLYISAMCLCRFSSQSLQLAILTCRHGCWKSTILAKSYSQTKRNKIIRCAQCISFSARKQIFKSQINFSYFPIRFGPKLDKMTPPNREILDFLSSVFSTLWLVEQKKSLKFAPFDCSQVDFLPKYVIPDMRVPASS